MRTSLAVNAKYDKIRLADRYTACQPVRPQRTRSGMASSRTTSFYDRIYAIVARIPYGQVTTYGDIATLAGRERAARQVGYAMHRCPSHLPWHRVINAQGRLSLPANSTAGIAQRRRLTEEGVVLLGGRIDLSCYRWRPSTDGIS